MALTNRTLLVFKYLWENTDDEHTASLADISSYLEENGLKKPDSRTLKEDINQLGEFGLDIVTERKVQNRYHIGGRHFDTAEVKLLIDAVQSSRFITPGKSKNLISKLAAFISPGQKSILKRQLYVDKRAKASNESIIRNVDGIFTAITDGRQIVFRYFDYSPAKKKIHRHAGQIYKVSPYDMLWNNDFYYFTAYDSAAGRVKLFRADRVDSLQVMNERAVKKPKDYSIDDYHSHVFSMYKGEECEVELICENSLMSNIIDRFGEKVYTEIADEQHFRVITRVAVSDVFYGWIFASEGRMRIAAPESAVNQFNYIINCFRQESSKDEGEH